jgi:hypothetical protein
MQSEHKAPKYYQHDIVHVCGCVVCVHSHEEALCFQGLVFGQGHSQEEVLFHFHGADHHFRLCLNIACTQHSTESLANGARSPATRRGARGRRGKRGARGGRGKRYLAAHEFLKATPGTRVSVTRDTWSAACTGHGSARAPTLLFSPPPLFSQRRIPCYDAEATHPHCNTEPRRTTGW